MPHINDNGYRPSNRDPARRADGADMMCTTSVLHWIYECWLQNAEASLDAVEVQNSLRISSCMPCLGGTPGTMATYLNGVGWIDQSDGIGNGIQLSVWNGGFANSRRGWLWTHRIGMALLEDNIQKHNIRPAQIPGRAIIKSVAGGDYVGWPYLHVIVEYYSSPGMVRYYDNIYPTANHNEYGEPNDAQITVSPNQDAPYEDLNMWIILDVDVDNV